MDPIPAQPPAPSGDGPTSALPLEAIESQTTEQSSSHPTTIDIPEEIQHLIFTFVFEGEKEPFIRKTRLIYCLVCRSMRAHHQAALFNRVELAQKYTGPSHILAFYRALSTSPNLGRLVHTLTIDICACWTHLARTLAWLPSLLPNIFELQLGGRWGIGCFEEFIREVLRCWRKTLRRLSIRYSSLWGFTRLLFGWEALERLRIDNSEDLFSFLQDPSDQAMSTSPPGPIQPISSDLPGFSGSFSLRTLSLHFEMNRHYLLQPRSTTGLNFVRFYGSRVSILHISGYFGGLPLSPGEFSSLKCLRIDIPPTSGHRQDIARTPLQWTIRFVKQRSCINRREEEWNLKVIQLDIPWFPKSKASSVVLLQMHELSGALAELNETVPKVLVVTKLGRLQRWEEFVQNLEGVEVAAWGWDVHDLLKFEE
ncbi:hypothetical protein DL96DRAFT_421155 [Flagelloscypha sp. PMI_526]|nr:hypothetical protein DL96DRAFT_421155 [Flagelloscypha sp. PMI_526]